MLHPWLPGWRKTHAKPARSRRPQGRARAYPLKRRLEVERLEDRLVLAGPVDLGSAESFGVLAFGVANIGATTIACDVGVSSDSEVTGFPPGIVDGTIHAGNAVALQAQKDFATAYDAAAGAAGGLDLGGPELGGRTLQPGVYRASSGDYTLRGTGTLTLDADGDPNAVWIFQSASTLTTASNSAVLLINGAQAGKVYWQVGGSAELGTASTFVGTILAQASIQLLTGASIASGRALARDSFVLLDTNNVVCPAPSLDPPAHPWHNSANGLDVNGGINNQPDGHVVAGDALAVINYINAFGSGAVPAHAAIGQPFGFLDTGGGVNGSGDNFIAPNDVLDVINAINAGKGGEGEGSRSQRSEFRRQRRGRVSWTS